MTSRLSFEPGSENLPMLDVFLPMMKSAALVAAGQLGLFEALLNEPLSAEALAEKIESHSEGVRRLSDVLVAVGYLDFEGGRYRNSERATQWFTSRGSIDYSAGLKWTARAWELQLSLAQCVKTGKPLATVWEHMERRPEWGSEFSLYMHAFAHHLGPDLVAHVTLPSGARRMLDLGGSHGEHSISFCKKYPELKSVIVDQASALSDTANTVAQAGLAHRISLSPGDLRNVAWGDGYDVVLFLSVMHNQTTEDNRQSIARVAQALRVGGTLVIHEYPHDEGKSVFDSAFDLTLLTETGTRMASSDDIHEWLNAAQLQVQKRVVLTPREKGTIFLAQRVR
jgi:hypothetical protein